MKIRDFVLAVILLFIAGDFAFADRQLDQSQIQQIFQTLTDQPRNTWIPAGTIEAKHLEYKASSGYVTESTVIVKYDGDRFYWEINIDSHTRQTQPQAAPNGKSSQDDLDLDWNKKRVFAWDGQQYTMYFRPGNQAIVTEKPSDIPVKVNGPLTAGIVPWGYGVYTYEELSAAESSAIEVEVDGRKQVQMELKKADTMEIVFVLDPSKDYAVLSWSLNYAGRPTIIQTYSNYEIVSGKWVPTTIVIERYDNSKQPPELFSYDEWHLTSINTSIPQPDFFKVAYETDALVEWYSSIIDKPLSYRYSNKVNTDSLFLDRLEIALAHGTQTQNCAMAATKYISEQLGKNVTDQKLAGLVNGPNKETSLYALRQFARGLGFHCLAVKTDIRTLKNLKSCQAILHLPRAKHYVVLEHIDDEYVWIIDLDANNFYYRTKLEHFGIDWSEGTALLLSNKPLDLEGTYTEIGEGQQHKIMGSDEDGFGYYSCTDLIQQSDRIYCPGMFNGVCGGRYRIYFERYGCKEDEQGGICIGVGIIGSISYDCIEDKDNPGACVGDEDEPYCKHIRACNN